MFINDWHYELSGIEAYDMFPQTAHVESVCVLKKRKV
jgi:tRNA/tmRNA/rRNA uracil-C5-methylase (TrmA/RlmC/RlmD family)